MNRCFDCLCDFAPEEDRFAVLKQLHEFPADWQGDDKARRLVEVLLWAPVFVCADCAVWYGDHAIRLSSTEARL